MSLPPLNGVEYDLDLEVKFQSGSSGGVLYKIILNVNFKVWCYLPLKKYLHPLFLRWFLLLQEFNSEVHNKGELGAVTLISSSVAPISSG